MGRRERGSRDSERDGVIVKLEMLESDAKVLRRAVLFASGDTASENRTLTRLWKMVDEAIKASRTLPPPDAEDCLLKDEDVNIVNIFFHDAATCQECVEDATDVLDERHLMAHLISENLR